MLAIDLAAVIIVIGVVFCSVAFGLHYRSKKLKGRTAISREQGKEKLLELMAELDSVCYLCHKLTGKSGLYIEATGQWCHDVCITKELNKGKV